MKRFLFLIDGQNGFWRRDWDQIGNITFYLERRWDELVGGKDLLVWEEGHSDDAAKSGIGENHIVRVGTKSSGGDEGSCSKLLSLASLARWSSLVWR